MLQSVARDSRAMVSLARLAMIDRPAGSILFQGPGWTVTAPAFLADVARVAADLPTGGTVANCCQDRYWFVVAFLAALSRGAVSLMSGDPSPARLSAFATQYPGLVSVSDDPTFTSPLPHVTIGPSAVRAIAAPLVEIAAEQTALIVFTSGSTGEPTGTVKNWGELVARSRAAGGAFGLSESAPAAIIGTVPPQHMYGLETTVLLPLHAPVSAWCGPVFYPADIRAALDEAPGTRILVTTPLQLRAMLRLDPPQRPPERIISATAPLDTETAAAAETAWGSVVEEIFGASEVGSIARRRTTAGPIWTLYPGVVLGGTEEAPIVTAPGAEPRRLNDVIERQAGGRQFRLLGRNSDLLKLGGRRASLVGLGAILTAIPGVEDGVFLAPEDLDRNDAARLTAFVVAPSLSAAAILAELRRSIDPVFLPRRLIHVPALPRTSMGKLPRQALLALLAETQARIES
jgi:acyl-coenzyme A synthetase/AMP-(fatty) acid ligase